ncbi:killer cell lectin-like receptor subfamily F member 1 [Heteronotia binoei]|uniref:killer cell lectin-like receptor subfamily F member 1 n=1 Tax=Heteronotia binoei TaxID=13085 RepID=UPI00292CAFD8|nr:killer cell lectin-like receptor subfamily F member 1 [Heteronotia binoei]
MPVWATHQDSILIATIVYSSHFTSFQESTTCKICPYNWHLYEKKCYWISREKLTWNQAMKNCTAKLSQMVVIQDQREVAFLQNIIKANKMLWIGLQRTSPERKWMWVDGSPYDNELSGSAETNACGKLNGNQIISDACINIANWICEKKALFLYGTQPQH